MTDAVTNGTPRQPIAGIVRTRIIQLQDRLGALETDARSRVIHALTTGNAKLRELDETLARVSRQDWTVAAVRRQLEALRARAESARASALKRVAEMPGTAVEALASGTRSPIQALSSRLAALAKRIDGGANGASGEKRRRNGKLGTDPGHPG